MKKLVSFQVLFLFFLSGVLLGQRPALVLQTGHNEAIRQLCYSYDGEWVASSSDDHTIKIWHSPTGKLCKTIDNFGKTAKALAFHPHQSLLLASCGNRILIWNIFSGKVVGQFKGHEGEVYALDLSQDGKYLVSGGEDEKIIVWNYAKRKQSKVLSQRLFYTNTIYSLKFSEDNNYIFSGGEDIHAKMWDWRKGKVVTKYRLHKYRINALDINSKGTLVATASNDHTIKVWDIFSGNNVATFKAYEAPVENVVFLPSRNRFIATYYKSFTDSSKFYKRERIEGHIALWDIDKEKVIWDMSYPGGVLDIALAPDGKSFIVGGTDKKIRHLSVSNGKEIRQMGGALQVNDIAYMPARNSLVVAADDGTLKIWDMKLGAITRTIPSTVNPKFSTVAYSQNFDLLAASWENVVEVWKYDNSIDTFRKMNTFTVADGNVSQLMFANKSGNLIIQRHKHFNTLPVEELEAYREGVIPDDLLSFRDSSFLEVWDPYQGNKINEFAHSSRPYIPCMTHPDVDMTILALAGTEIMRYDPGRDNAPSRYIIPSVSRRRTKFSQAATAGIALAPEQDAPSEIKNLTISSDSRFVAYSKADGGVSIYDARNNEDNLLPDFTGNVTALAFTPDNSQLAIATPNSLIVWDIFKQQTVRKFQTKATPSKMLFSQEGERLMTLSPDGGIQVWDVETENQLITLALSSETDYAVVTPDMYYHSSPGGLKAVAVMFDNIPYPLECFRTLYNQPGMVAAALSPDTRALYQSYKGSYLKYLGLQDFVETDLYECDHIPRIQILDKNLIRTKTRNRYAKIEVRATDLEFPIDRIQVYINNNPIYGFKGLSTRKEETDVLTRTLNFELSHGKNNIKVTCLNSKGVESLADSITIYYKPNVLSASLHVVDISATTFLNDSSLILHSGESATELARVFAADSLNYEQVVVHRLADDGCTKLQIKDLFMKLADTKVNDKVVVVMSGLTVLDQSMQPCFSTWDVDFKTPEKLGLPFHELAAYFNMLPARDKLLLMEAPVINSYRLDNQKVTPLSNLPASVDSTKVPTIGKTSRDELLLDTYFPETRISKSHRPKETSAAIIVNYNDLMQEALFGNASWLAAFSASGTVALCSTPMVQPEIPVTASVGFLAMLMKTSLNGKADIDGNGRVFSTELNAYFTRYGKHPEYKSYRPIVANNPGFEFKVW